MAPGWLAAARPARPSAAIMRTGAPAQTRRWPRLRILAAVGILLAARAQPTTAHILAPPPLPGSLLDAAVKDVLAHSAAAAKILHGTGVPTLAKIFNNTFTFTAVQTWQDFHDGTVFIDTGDIQQQWLRDSCNQMVRCCAISLLRALERH